MNNYLPYSIEQLFALSVEELNAIPKADNPYAPINGYLRYDKINDLKSSPKFRCQSEDKTNAEPLKTNIFEQINGKLNTPIRTRNEAAYDDFLKRNFGSVLPSASFIRSHAEFESLALKPTYINGIRQNYKSLEQQRLEKQNSDYLLNEDFDLLNDFENRKAASIIRIIHSGINKKKKKENSKRRKFSYNERVSVFDRDGSKCLCCGESAFSELTIDHIIPLSKGGTNDFDNLQTLCDKCNFEKGVRIRNYREITA